MINPQVASGILFGFGAAFSQSFSYVFSRRFLTEYKSNPVTLFGLSHVIMGIASLIALPLLIDKPLPDISLWIRPLIGVTFSYLFAQFLLFTALKRIDSSMISPLLGMKIPILGVASALLTATGPGIVGWMMILLCVIGGLIISPPKGLPALGALLLVFFICLGYCGSDWCIPYLVDAVGQSSSLPAVLAVSIKYSLCGFIRLTVVIARKSWKSKKAWSYAWPHSLSWMLGMIFLFACFHNIGVVSGNMLQSSRGLISVIIGVSLTKMGFLHLDNMTGKNVFRRRLVGAIIMTTAIIIYLKFECKPRTPEPPPTQEIQLRVAAKINSHFSRVIFSSGKDNPMMIMNLFE